MLGLLWATPLLAKTSEQDAKSKAATHGYVYASFPKVSNGFLTVTPAAGGREWELAERQDPGHKAQGLWLPEGDYRIARWGPYAWEPAQSFHVQAGRVTDLGSLLSINVGGYAQVFVSVHPAEKAHAIDAALDEYGGALVSREPIACCTCAVQASVDWEVYTYDRASDDWKKASTAPTNCRPARVSAAYPTFCFSSDAAIYRLGTAGWEAEFPLR